MFSYHLEKKKNKDSWDIGNMSLVFCVLKSKKKKILQNYEN